MRVVYFHKACYCYCMTLQDTPKDASTNLKFSAFGRNLGTREVYFLKACYCYCMALQDIPLELHQLTSSLVHLGGAWVRGKCIF